MRVNHTFSTVSTKEAWFLLLRALFGNGSFDETAYDFQFDTPPHLLFLAENFTPDPVKGYAQRVNYTVEGLAKVLFYGSHVKSRAEAQGISPKDVILEDLMMFPYTRKKDIKVRTYVF